MTDLAELLDKQEITEICYRYGLALDNRDGTLGALAQAGPQPVAVDIGDQPRFAIDDLDRPFGTRGHTQTASITFRLVDADDLAFDHEQLA